MPCSCTNFWTNELVLTLKVSVATNACQECSEINSSREEGKLPFVCLVPARPTLQAVRSDGTTTCACCRIMHKACSARGGKLPEGFSIEDSAEEADSTKDEDEDSNLSSYAEDTSETTVESDQLASEESDSDDDTVARPLKRSKAQERLREPVTQRFVASSQALRNVNSGPMKGTFNPLSPQPGSATLQLRRRSVPGQKSKARAIDKQRRRSEAISRSRNSHSPNETICVSSEEPPERPEVCRSTKPTNAHSIASLPPSGQEKQLPDSCASGSGALVSPDYEQKLTTLKEKLKLSNEWNNQLSEELSLAQEDAHQKALEVDQLREELAEARESLQIERAQKDMHPEQDQFVTPINAMSSSSTIKSAISGTEEPSMMPSTINSPPAICDEADDAMTLGEMKQKWDQLKDEAQAREIECERLKEQLKQAQVQRDGAIHHRDVFRPRYESRLYREMALL